MIISCLFFHFYKKNCVIFHLFKLLYILQKNNIYGISKFSSFTETLKLR